MCLWVHLIRHQPISVTMFYMVHGKYVYSTLTVCVYYRLATLKLASLINQMDMHVQCLHVCVCMWFPKPLQLAIYICVIYDCVHPTYM